MPSQFFKKNLKNFKAYTPGKQPQKATGHGALQTVVKLNTNENPYPAPSACTKAIEKIVKSNALKLYPNPNQTKLREAAAFWMNSATATNYYKLNANKKKIIFTKENFIFGNGSDELISAIFRTFVSANNKVAIPKPGYGAYAVYASSYNIGTHYYGCNKNFFFNYNSASTSEAFSKCKVVFITNPAAPSGTHTTTKNILTAIKKHKNVLFIIDEAYIDFTSEGSMSGHIHLPNIIVLRTFSKAPSLAGLRLGWAIANPQLTYELKIMLDPYNVNMLSQAAGEAALKQYMQILKTAGRIITNRNKLAISLAKLGFIVTKSSANFLLVKFPKIKTTALNKTKKNSASLHSFLQTQNIYVRHFNALPNYLRITVGSSQENAILLKKIKEYLSY